MKPKESFDTFSRGQNEQNKNVLSTTAAASSGHPIFEYASTSSLGAYQPASKLGSTAAQPLVSTKPPTSTESENFRPEVPRGVAVPPKFKPIRSGRNASLLTRQLWEGTVTELRDDGSFVAVLADKTDPGNSDEIAAFSPEDVTDDEVRLVKVGSSFYWIIGSERTPTGVIKTVSMVRFRRVPAWTQSKLKRAAELARHAADSGRDEKE
jgi:hypothetical protein